TFEFNGEQHELKITKFYPVVENGRFQVDMEFTGQVPPALTRGQSLRIALQLGDTSAATLLARGGFYQSTGGKWIYKIVRGGKQAVRQNIRLGRQNPNYFEVLSGLRPGDKVITSGYETF